MRHVLMLCAVTIVAGNVACSRGKLASPTDGSTDRRDASGDVAVDAGPGDLPPESRDGQDARDGSDAGDARDGAADMPAADVVTGGGDASDGRGDAGDAPVDAAGADRPPDAILDSSIDGADGADGQGDAGDGPGETDATVDGASSDAPVEAGRPFIERDCSRADACVCASNESCSFTCPGGDCAVTCAPGSSCTVSCAAPFGCSVSCGTDAQCILACFLGVCAHWFGPAGTLVCDSAGTGCI